MKPIYQIAIILACFIRVVGQSLWMLIDSPQFYYVTQGLFELFALLILTAHCHGGFKIIMNFFVGVCAFSLLKEIWKPTELDLNEYIGFAVGAIFTAYSAWKNSRK